MLYVFQVDTGVMMTFEMRLAMDTVGNLKRAIAAKTDVPEDNSAGTDTSPIYLFAKINIESNQPPTSNVDYGDDADMTEMIESCMSMQPSLDTLVARTELSADLNEQATKQKEVCERLVHDQHLQQQGWAAVTANLEDLTRAFKNKAEMLMLAFSEFTKCKPSHKELLNKFGDDIRHLDNIPILPVLIESNKLITSISTSTTKEGSSHNDNSKPQSDGSKSGQAEEKIHDANVETEGDSSPTQPLSQSAQPQTPPPPPSQSASLHSKSDPQEEQLITMRQWIDCHDSHNSLERLIELCWRGLERFTEANAEQIRHEVHELLKSANNSSMKEIKGLEERLFGLEKLMVDAKKVVDEQGQLASSFQNNRERFSKIKDSTLLPDLSASHKQQLQMMLTNHKKMSDYRNRCIKAKQELSVNLLARLKWIMYIEQQISDLDGKLMIYKKNLTRLNRLFEIVEQTHRSPDLYLEAVVETLRRRRFSRRYLHWANSIAKISQELYEKEMSTRKEFETKLGTHFLSNLFPGLARSYPPPFATVQLEPFDTKLPRITAADIQYLQANLGDELSVKLQIPEDVPMPHVICTPGNFDAEDDDENTVVKEEKEEEGDPKDQTTNQEE